MILDELNVPIIQAPMAGGPSTPALAAAVSEAGALGFVAGANLPAEKMRAQIAQTRALTGRPFGVNLFVPSWSPADPAAIAPYAERLADEARRHDVDLGDPRTGDDDFPAKLESLLADPPAVASFTFGCPPADTVAGLHERGSELWVTVTSVGEARAAAALGADVLVLQGAEAGGHRGTWTDEDDGGGLGVLALLQLVRAATGLPLVAAGGIATAGGVAAVLAAGASAAQVGTAFMRCPEAGTLDFHRRALAEPTPTMLTRAFSGRLARGLVNRFAREHSDVAPRGYPEVHHLTTPLRAAGRAAQDAEVVNLWAGQAHELAREAPAAEVVRELTPP